MASKISKLFPYLKFVWASCILVLTLKPGDGDPLLAFLDWPGVDKAGHFIIFFIWALLHFPEAVFKTSMPAPPGRKFWIVATNSLVLGLAIEVIQQYIPGRSGDAVDLLADLLGMVVALGVVKIVRWNNSDLN